MLPVVRYTLSRREKLKSNKKIKELFSKGSNFFIYPIKVIYLPDDTGDSHQMLVSVPKRNFKKAKDRNLIKRRIRESYRLNKHSISNESKLNIALIYNARDILAFKDIQNKLIRIIRRLNEEPR
ncbi:MAG: ribonuclease P protein component [Bacteroidota bacterium]